MRHIKKWKKGIWYGAAFLVINLLAILWISRKEHSYINNSISSHAEYSMNKAEDVMDNYLHSFSLFSHMLARETEQNPNPDDIWNYLKSIDTKMLEIEGDTFDGLYMYYKGRYLYSWDTPYSEYEDTGYIATERPWYKDAAAGNGAIVFTPPYMSYANHYILSTISQLQPDGETVFAYDIKLGDIQDLVSSLTSYPGEQMMVFDSEGTVIGSTKADYLGGDLYASLEDTANALKEAEGTLKNSASVTQTQKEKLQEQVDSLKSFYSFQKSFDQEFARLNEQKQTILSLHIGKQAYYGYLLPGNTYHILSLVPVSSMLKDSVHVWLVPLLILELLLIYVFGRISKAQKNHELQEAYVELGQTQKRLELALSAAQKAAAIDDLTGMMNFKSFRKGVSALLDSMEPEENGILIMIDGDHFKTVNDTYGHQIGDEVIKLSAQMIIGRIRTIDLASRLHGDEFAIFVANTKDYTVAKKIMEDINHTLAKEAKRRNLPAITLSSGAVCAKHGDSYTVLAKMADAALYIAKEGHNGGFSSAPKP